MEEKPENPYVYAMCDEASFMQQGITLRDHFAGLAMQAICAHSDNWGIENIQKISHKCYEIADTMLEQRLKS